MTGARFAIAIASLSASLGACGACSDKKADPSPATGASAAGSSTPLAAVAEVLPRCRQDGARTIAEGDDVVFGAAALSSSSLFVGHVRRKDGKRIGSVLRASLDLAQSRTIDVGPSFGDDPAPTPFLRDGKPFVAFLVRKDVDAGTTRGMRELRIAPLEEGGIGPLAATIMQQADESTAFDVAWPLVAWDEDALVPVGRFVPDRGVVKVALVPDGKPHVVSPDGSDAESPKLARRKGGGFWLAWLARRPEVEDAGYRLEGAGDLRAWRWVELVALDDKGELASPVRRISPPTGHALAFDIVASDPELVVVVQDEAGASEGTGSRIVRYAIDGEHVTSHDIVDGGVGQALAEIVATPDAGWIAWTDTSDRAWLAPSTASAAVTGTPTAETALDGARVLAAAGGPTTGGAGGPGVAGALFVTSGSEIRRFACSN